MLLQSCIEKYRAVPPCVRLLCTFFCPNRTPSQTTISTHLPAKEKYNFCAGRPRVEYLLDANSFIDKAIVQTFRFGWHLQKQLGDSACATKKPCPNNVCDAKSVQHILVPWKIVARKASITTALFFSPGSTRRQPDDGCASVAEWKMKFPNQSYLRHVWPWWHVRNEGSIFDCLKGAELQRLAIASFQTAEFSLVVLELENIGRKSCISLWETKHFFVIGGREG